MRTTSFPPGCKVTMNREEEKGLDGYSDEPLIKGPRPCEIKSMYWHRDYECFFMELVGGYISHMSFADYEGPECDGHGSTIDSRDTIDCTMEEYIKAFFKRDDPEELFNGFWSGEYYYCFHIDVGNCKIRENTVASWGTLRKPKGES